MIIQEFGVHLPEFEEIFEWVYEAPILEWKIRLYCVSYYYHRSQSRTIDFRKAHELLSLISK